jgi:TonB family protein
MPEYPRIAASLNIVGAVQLQAVVRADGTVKQVRVIGGHPALAEAAAAAVMRWRYERAAKETTETVKITFAD